MVVSGGDDGDESQYSVKVWNRANGHLVIRTIPKISWNVLTNNLIYLKVSCKEEFPSTLFNLKVYNQYFVGK